MADQKISARAAAAALGGTEQLAGVQSAADVAVTPAQINTYVRSTMATGVSAFLTTPTVMQAMLKHGVEPLIR